MRWGIQLPVQSRSTVYAEAWEADAGPDEVARVALAAEAAGAAYVAVCDHVWIPADRAETMSAEWWDTVATLGWLAGVTERVGLLSHVYVPAYRHPLAVAKAFATLDAVSGGRVILGVGAGHVAEEFAALGVDFDRRGALLDEAIDGVRAAWADGSQLPRPVQAPGPPIWVGGSSVPARRRAAQRGDGWLPQGPVTADEVDEITRRRAEAGRNGPFTVGALAGPVHVGEPGWDLGGPALTGPPAKLGHVLAKLAALGVDQVQIRPRSRSADELVDQLAAFGAEVAPLLDTAEGAA